MHSRKEYFDKISRLIAIIRYDIEQHQTLNDFSLNIHGENYFRDVFNFIYDSKYENANHSHHNHAYIDLIDHQNKRFVQITTSRTKDKILHSLKAYQTPKYKGYRLQIFYLLEKANPNAETCKEISVSCGIDIKECLKNATDLINDIANLEEAKLQELYQKYFSDLSEKYTDEIVLNLVIKKLLKEVHKYEKNYDDDLGSIEVMEKIILNDLTERIKSKIFEGVDFSQIIEKNLESQERHNLQELVVHDYYKNILIEQLRSKERKEILDSSDTQKLHELAKQHNICMSKTISSLKEKIESEIFIKDLNSINISWIIVAYFFEICDVGQKQ